jgi:hypothetical protein
VTGSFGGGQGRLYHFGTDVLASSSFGYAALVARRFSARPGDSLSIAFSIGIASCEPGPDYMVPPGRYEAAVPITLNIDGRRDTVQFIARGCPATVY